MQHTRESKQNLLENETLSAASSTNLSHVTETPLGPIEKLFLLHVERGDCDTVKRLIEEYRDKPEELDINCVDPLNRSAIVAAIENGNIELIKLLLNQGIEVKDSLLHAIKEEFVEAVELLLGWEEQYHKSGQPYSWELIDSVSSTFTPDITPLILAAHKNNYEILKILLDRGATLPVPHDIKCGCDNCIELNKINSLRHSQARINAYKALIAPSLIALSSKDPLLTAFELSRELRKLSRLETEFRAEYDNMRTQIQNFSTSLLDCARTSYELEVMLNYDPKGDNWDPGERQTLERLKLAIKCKQKMFVAHPNVQQLLAAIWFEGVPGFRRKNFLWQTIQIGKLMLMCPVYCMIYIIAPTSKMGQFIRKPFVKFICHSSSYMIFLMFVSMASQRLEIVVLEWFSTEWIREVVDEWKRKERGAAPGIAECVVILYVISLIWSEIRALWTGGLQEYLSDLWNVVDFIINMFYFMWISLRLSSFYIVWKEANEGKDPWYPREQWHSFDPMLLSEGAFAAGMIFSFLKLVHIFSVSPHLGPLQISLGRMIIDIVKFFFIYTLVLFAFGCGLNQLLWYYAELEKNKCYLSNGTPDFDKNEKACTIWRRYANLFETSQSLFWASFGLIDLLSFELTGIKDFTRFWALLMFGSYSVINVIVLLNMFIAMMSNSYEMIFECCDTEWKYARSRLWLNYFEEKDTLPPPFNILPTPKRICHLFRSKQNIKDEESFKRKTRNRAQERHEFVMQQLIKRYITTEQQKRDVYGVTEDDVMEIRQDISGLRFELISILRKNGMKTPQVSEEDAQVSGKKDKVIERRILGDFYIGALEGVVGAMVNPASSKNLFTKIAKAVGRHSRKSRRQNWNALVRKQTINQDPIGSFEEATTSKLSRRSVMRHDTNAGQNELIENNPNLQELSRATRVAYKKFMSKKIQQEFAKANEKLVEDDGTAIAAVDSLKSSPLRSKDMETESSKESQNHHFCGTSDGSVDNLYTSKETRPTDEISSMSDCASGDGIASVVNKNLVISDSKKSGWL